VPWVLHDAVAPGSHVPAVAPELEPDVAESPDAGLASPVGAASSLPSLSCVGKASEQAASPTASANATIQ
jgi:hypothetical protein